MPHPSVEDRLKGILLRLIDHHVQPVNIKNDVPFVTQGLALDSLALLEFAVAMEDEFKISVADEDITRDLFENVNSLAHYVRKRMESR
jgi:acyl carrier protein